MKKLTVIQLLLMVVLITTLLFYITTHQLISFSVGSGAILLNFLLLGAGWGLIFRKKLIALSVGIIVFKYAILGIIIFQIAKQPWLQPLWFCLGIASFVITALIYSLIEVFSEGKEHVV
ncbi:hypothetical protein D3C87_87050 [compost metagenome]